MTTSAQAATEQTVEVVGRKTRILRGGSGDPVFVLHHSIGNHGWLPLHERLAEHFTVYVPDLPGYGQSERPEWARDMRDMALVMHLLFDRMDLDEVSLVGLGFGGWLAAEMAPMNQRRVRRMVLVGAAGIQPTDGEIMDQMLMDYTEYVQSGFHDPEAYRRIFGDELEMHVKELWDYSREMTARLAWKPYMFNRRLPHVLREVRTPTLVVWGDDDRVVPMSSGQQYREALPNARLEVIENCGHLVDLEQPERLAELVQRHLAS